MGRLKKLWWWGGLLGLCSGAHAASATPWCKDLQGIDWSANNRAHIVAQMRPEAQKFLQQEGLSGSEDDFADAAEFVCFSADAEAKKAVLQRLELSARQGSDFASMMLMAIYLEGLGGIAKDEEAAKQQILRWVERSPQAMALVQRKVTGKSAPQELRFLQTTQAANGNARYMLPLGKLLVEEQRKKEALPWLRLAAAAGGRGANAMLSGLYLVGWQETTTDLAQARYWAQQAVEQQDPFGYFLLGLVALLEPAPSGGTAQALAWFRQGAQRRDRMSAQALMQMQRDGLGGARDPAAKLPTLTAAMQSTVWPDIGGRLQKALSRQVEPLLDNAREAEWEARAQQGVLDDQEALGLRFAEHKDPRALPWLRKAAEQGSVRAMRELGILLASAQGHSQQVQEGVRWYAQAAAQGDLLARSWLASAYQSGEVVPRSYPMAFALEYAAAQVMAASGVQVDLDLERFAPWVKSQMNQQEIERGQQLARALLQPGQFARVLAQGVAQ